MNQIENKAIFEEMPIPKAAKKLMIPTVLSSLVMVIYSLAERGQQPVRCGKLQYDEPGSGAEGF